MLTTLFILEFAIMMTAASVVAWLRYPYRDSDDYRLGCLRFLAPLVAVFLFLMCIVAFHDWLVGSSFGEPPSAVGILFFTAMMALSILWATVEMRKSRAARVSRTTRASRKPRDGRYVSAHRPRRRG
jgi:hypothetical protein